MTSQFAYAVHEQRHQLLTQLVTKLLQVKPDDENYSLALDFCLQKAYYHSFADVNPRQTEEFYADLVSRLEGDSQPTKAAALSALTSKVLALKLQSSAGVLELNHNLLQLLASLTNNPLSSSLDLTPDVLYLLYKPAAAVGSTSTQQQQELQGQLVQPVGSSRFQKLLRGAGAKQAGGADAGGVDSGDEYDPYGDASSLSDWEDSEGQQQQHPWAAHADSSEARPGGMQQVAQDQQQQLHPAEGPLRQLAAPAGAAGTAVAAAAYTNNLGPARLPQGWVVPSPHQPAAKLAALRPQKQTYIPEQPLLQPPQQQQQVCLSELFLSHQVLQAMQGLPAQGFIMRDPRAQELQSGLSTHQPHPILHSASSWGRRASSRSYSGGGSSSGGGNSSSSSSTTVSLNSEQYFVVDARVCTPQMLPGALHAVMADAAAAGTCARQLRALVQQLAFGKTVGNGVQVTPCLRACGVALQQQLDSLGLLLAELQEQLQAKHDSRVSTTSGSSSSRQQQCERGLPLRFVTREARPVMRRLRLLHTTMFGILQQLSGSPAAVSAGLIDGLTDAVQEASVNSGPQGVAGAAALLHLLLCSCVPLSRALAQWLWCATDATEQAAAQHQRQQQDGVSVCSQDFFIVRKASSDVAAVHPSFWHTAYGFSSAAGQASAQASAQALPESSEQAAAEAPAICCPAVLAPFAHSIMTAGKSMRLLDFMDQEDLKQCSKLPGLFAAALAIPGKSMQAGTQLQSCWGIAAAGHADGAAAGPALLQRQPSTPRRRRPSSAGGLIGGGSSAGAAAGSGILARRLSRPASAAGRPGGRTTAAEAGLGAAGASEQMRAVGSRQSSRKMWGAAGPDQLRPAAAAAIAAAGGDVGTAAAAVAGVAAGGGTFSRRLKVQLAAAAAVAGRQAQEELPSEFISSVCYLLRQEQQLQDQAVDQMRQHQQYLQQCSSSTPSSSSSGSVGPMLLQRLEAIASCIANPHDPAAAGGEANSAGGSTKQHDGQEGGSWALSLRDAMYSARKARLAEAAVLDGSQLQNNAAAQAQQMQMQDKTQLQVQQQQLSAAAAAADQCAAGAASDGSNAGGTTESLEGPGGCSSSSTQHGCSSPLRDPPTAELLETLAPATPPKGSHQPEAAADSAAVAVQAPGPAAAAAEAGSSSSSSPGAGCNSPDSPDLVPKLTVWRDQLEAKLSTVGQQLQRMAPRQPLPSPEPNSTEDTRQQSDCAKAAKSISRRKGGSSGTSSSSKSWLLQTADAECPAHFTGSLAELWPLKPVVGLRAAARGASSSSSGNSSGAWLCGAAWPGADLAWLLHDPPSHLPSVQQLLWTAFVQPVRARVELVDRQLMASLMGEWGMLQQLEGLVNAFLVSSPSMVEWVEALFTAVEVAKASNSSRARGTGEGTTPPASRTLARTAAAAAGGAWVCDSPGAVASPSGRGGSGANVLGKIPVGVEDLELPSLEAMLKECISSAGPHEVLPECESLVFSANSEALHDLRSFQDRRQAAAAAAAQQAAAASSSSSAAAASPKGLILCSREWVGLDLQHTGSWQLSLVYTSEQLRMFGQVWRLMLQLRWVRRRVGAQAVAHRVSAAANSLALRDAQEASEVAAAAAAQAAAAAAERQAGRAGVRSTSSFGTGSPVVGRSSSFSLQHGYAGAAGAAGSAATAAGVSAEWLSGKEELLLLQEMWHFLSCWHGYILNGIRVKAWERLEQALVSAQSLDQVHSATQAFFATMCSFCNLNPAAATAAGSKHGAPSTQQATKRHSLISGVRKQLEDCMDAALAAAAAAGRVHAARQKLSELQRASDRAAAMKKAWPWWGDLAAARNTLRQASTQWRKGLTALLQLLVTLENSNRSHVHDELLQALDMNGYFRKVVDKNGSDTFP